MHSIALNRRDVKSLFLWTRSQSVTVKPYFFFFFLAQNEELTLKEKFVITKVALFNVTEDKIQTYFPCEITNVTLHMEMFKQKRFSIFINFF